MTVEVRYRKTDIAYAIASDLATQRLYGCTPWSYWLKRSLVAAGWTVYYSSDGVTTSSSDLWTTSSFQAVMLHPYAGGANTTDTVDGIWCCLRSPDMDANGDYLHICLSPRAGTWSDPVARGPSNDMSVYGVNKYCGASGYYQASNEYLAALLIGMTVSSSLTAFSGGAPYASTSNLTAIGERPTAPGVVWVTKPMGNSQTNTSIPHLTIVTSGNQFHVIISRNTTIASGYHSWYSLCAMDNGGYAIIEESRDISTLQFYGSNALHGGSRWELDTSINTPGFKYATELGGWRSAYVKRAADSSIWSGGLARPEPPGWEAAIESPSIVSGTTAPYSVQLQARSCSNLAHTGLGLISDFVMMGGYGIEDLDILSNNGTGKRWLAMKNARAILLQWSLTDMPKNYVTITPP